jgi:hypothetical protein
LVSVVILALSVVGMVRFAILYWRGLVIRTAELPISEEVRVAAQLPSGEITGRDFAALAGLLSLTPGGSGGVTLVRAYFRMVQVVATVGRTQAACAAWAEREMAICARYVGVQIDGRLQMSFAEQVGTV